MKVIDLLNKIANGEEVPKKIKYKWHIYQYQYKDTKEANIINYYYSEETHHHLIDGGWHDIRLNDEVEIIEEDKKIEKIDHLIGYDIRQFEDLREYVEITTNDLFGKTNKNIDKINELIDEVNKLKEGKDE